MSIDSLCMRDCPRKAQLAFRSIREIICGWPLWLLATTIAVYCHGAQAHGIVGNRVFPGSFAFDDPAVMDELLFGFSRLRHPDDGTEVLDHQADWAFSRLLTPTLAIEFDGGWLHRNWGPTQRSGLDTTAVGLKALLYKNDIQEVMISAGIAWGIGGTGSQAVAANSVDTLNPGVFFGKGFGDAPASLSWLRPLAITGAVALEHPLQAAATNLGVDPASGQLQPTLTAFNDILHWGISLQYSTYYLSRRFSPGKLPKDEPVNQFIPLVEFAFDMPMPHEGKGTGTMNPGVAYVSEKWQVLAEAVIPLNGEAGHAIGVRAGLLLFLDDLFPLCLESHCSLDEVRTVAQCGPNLPTVDYMRRRKVLATFTFAGGFAGYFYEQSPRSGPGRPRPRRWHGSRGLEGLAIGASLSPPRPTFSRPPSRHRDRDHSISICRHRPRA